MESSKISKKSYSRFLFPLLIALFVFLHLMLISAFAKGSDPLYGQMERFDCGQDTGIDELKQSCLLLFESVDGSPKYGVIYPKDNFYYNPESIKGKFGYIDLNYIELLKNSPLLYKLQEIDDSYFYAWALDNGLHSLTILEVNQ